MERLAREAHSRSSTPEACQHHHCQMLARLLNKTSSQEAALGFVANTMCFPDGGCESCGTRSEKGLSPELRTTALCRREKRPFLTI